MTSAIKEIAITLGLALVIYLLFHVFIHNAIVNMSSMQPTLFEGQRLFAEKQFLDPGRGDIIIIHPPPQVAPAGEEFVKRLIGLPGDTIQITGGTVYVNGVGLVEPYIKAKPAYAFGPFKVPAGNYFVLGDNRNNSTDSHFGWTITRQDIVGKAVLRYWPLNKFGGAGNFNLNAQVEQGTPSLSSTVPFLANPPDLIAALPSQFKISLRGP